MLDVHHYDCSNMCFCQIWFDLNVNLDCVKRKLSNEMERRTAFKKLLFGTKLASFTGFAKVSFALSKFVEDDSLNGYQLIVNQALFFASHLTAFQRSDKA